MQNLKLEKMKNVMLLLLAYLLVNNVSAKKPTNNEDFEPGPIDTVNVTKKFDGVWKGPGNVTLIKQLKGYVILQGKDAQSTWLAKGVIKGEQIICRGNGLTNKGTPFVYESMMTLKNGKLVDQWKAIFSEEKTLEGKDELVLLKIDQKMKDNETTR